MIIVFMSIVAALVLLLLTPAGGQTQPMRKGELSPRARRVLLGGACVALLVGMVAISGGIPGLIDREIISQYDEAAVSRVTSALSQHATAMNQNEWMRGAIIQQTFGAAMLAMFAVMFRNRRR